jgi:DNA modification methylase/ParB-like chromosome segregation protein Spo0J
MAVSFIKISDVKIVDRARTSKDTDKLLELKKDISSSKVGLMNPITVYKEDLRLIAGERRLLAVTMMNDFNEQLRFSGKEVPDGYIPAIVVDTLLDSVDLLSAELAENAVREDFTWKDRAALEASIVRLKQLQIEKGKGTLPDMEREVVDSLVYGTPVLSTDTSQPAVKPLVISKEAIKEAATELSNDSSVSQKQSKVKQSLRIDGIVKGMEEIPDEWRKRVLNAGSSHEAMAIINKFDTQKRQAIIAKVTGETFRSEDNHRVFLGDSVEVLRTLDSASVDVCLTDPIYGINAANLGLSGKSENVHDYDDSYATWLRVMPAILQEVSRVCKPDAHMYLFCDFRRYHELAYFVANASKENPWTIQNYPLLWVKLNGGRCPIPGRTYRKNVEYILFAWRGDKSTKLVTDCHINVSTTRSEIHAAAKDPSGLRQMLNVSCHPGELVLDFMAGSGSTAVTCKELKLRSISIESNEAHYGRIIERLKG